jgi:hypothetical protein
MVFFRVEAMLNVPKFRTNVGTFECQGRASQHLTVTDEERNIQLSRMKDGTLNCHGRTAEHFNCHGRTAEHLTVTDERRNT